MKLEPCPFCGTHLVEATAFETRSTKTFVHNPDIDCPAQSINVMTPNGVERWNRRALSTSSGSAAPVAWQHVRQLGIALSASPLPEERASSIPVQGD